MRRETFPILTACGQATNNYAHSSYISPDAVGGKPSNYDLIAPRSRNPNHTTAAELGDEYIACHSSRARALDDLQRKINGHVSEEHQLNVATGNARYDLLTNIATDPQAFNVGIVNLDNAGSVTPLMDRLEDQGKHLQPCIPTPNEDPPAGATDIEKAIFYLSYPERLLENSDGLVLLPDSTRASGSKMSLEEKLYILQSIVVAKQLIPRDKHKPVVIVNTDHSWDDAIRIHTALAQCQMTKDHVLPLAYKLPDVNVTANGYFSVINGGQDKYEAALAGAAFIMKDKSLSYHRVASLPNKTSQEGTSPYARDYEQHYRKNQVAIFCSASSENAPLNHFVSDISRKLVAAGKSIICGGGDRYTMGAILEGVEKYRDSFGSKLAVKERKKTAYIAGISTYPIAAAETNSGKMPEEYSYRELATNIYERMAKMMVSAETVLVAPGGAGTIQEWMGFNLLKKKMPTLFSNKKLVIFDPDLLTNPEHRVIGEPATETSSLQNRVFDGVLDIIFDGKTNQHRFSSQYNRTGTFVVSKVDEVVESCLALERSR